MGIKYPVRSFWCVVINVITQTSDREVSVSLFNPSEKAITLLPRMWVTKLSKVQTVAPKEQVTTDKVKGEIHVKTDNLTHNTKPGDVHPISITGDFQEVKVHVQSCRPWAYLQ